MSKPRLAKRTDVEEDHPECSGSTQAIDASQTATGTRTAINLIHDYA
jgi:hypothetical protein